MSEESDQRYRTAERVAASLANPPYGRPGLANDYVASFAVPTTIDDAPGAREALVGAAKLAATISNSDERFVKNTSGPLVARLHGPSWSVVFSFLPFTGVVFICVDDMLGHCWIIDDDSPEAESLIHDLYENTILGMKYAGEGVHSRVRHPVEGVRL